MGDLHHAQVSIGGSPGLAVRQRSAPWIPSRKLGLRITSRPESYRRATKKYLGEVGIPTLRLPIGYVNGNRKTRRQNLECLNCGSLTFAPGNLVHSAFLYLLYVAQRNPALL